MSAGSCFEIAPLSCSAEGKQACCQEESVGCSRGDDCMTGSWSSRPMLSSSNSSSRISLLPATQATAQWTGASTDGSEFLRSSVLFTAASMGLFLSEAPAAPPIAAQSYSVEYAARGSPRLPLRVAVSHNSSRWQDELSRARTCVLRASSTQQAASCHAPMCPCAIGALGQFLLYMRPRAILARDSIDSGRRRAADACRA